MAEFNNLSNVKLPLPVHLCFPQHPNSLRVYELIKKAGHTWGHWRGSGTSRRCPWNRSPQSRT